MPAIEFDTPWSIYMPGDVAGFKDETCAQLIALGKAHLYARPAIEQAVVEAPPVTVVTRAVPRRKRT